MTLTVSFEDRDSRIQLQGRKTVWTSGDLVSVFYRSNANQKWSFQGKTGERTAQLRRVEMGAATEAMSDVIVIYPYSEKYQINTNTYEVGAYLPAMQSYLADSYGIDGNIMVSQSEYNQFALKSVCGWLKLQLTGNGEKISKFLSQASGTFHNLFLTSFHHFLPVHPMSSLSLSASILMLIPNWNAC